MFAFILAAAFALPPQQSDAVIGVSAIHLETGRRVSIRGAERFPMGSVYKFPIGLAVLRAMDEGKLSLDTRVTVTPDEFAGGWSPLRDEANGKPVEKTVGELLELMVSMSDNSAADSLLRLVGGPAAVTTWLKELGAAGVRVDRSEKDIGAYIQENGDEAYVSDPRDTATPDAMADLLLTFWYGRDGLSSGSHALLLQHLTESRTGAGKIRAGVPSGWSVAHKSGMMPQTSNDVGIVTSPDGKQHIALAIFSTRAKSDYKIVEVDIAAITRAVVAALAK